MWIRRQRLGEIHLRIEYQELPETDRSWMASQVSHWYSIYLLMQEVCVQALGWEDLLEKEMAIHSSHSSILAWEIPWTEEPGGLQSMGSQRVRHDLVSTTTTTTNRNWKKKGRMLNRKHGPINTLISDFQSPELWENKFLLFQAFQFVIFVTGAPGSQYTIPHSFYWLKFCRM